MKLYSRDFRITKMASTLGVSTRGYYAWLNRGESHRELANAELSKKVESIFNDSRGVYGSRKIKHELQRKYGESVGKTRVLRLMKQSGLWSKVRKKYKATTNSNHGLPVAKNHLNREFDSEKPNKKLVSDITYIWTDEGWLYLAAVMDLCGEKIVGVAMDGRMTKELVMEALTDAVNRSGKSDNGILHSDRGSQYCSHEYQKLLRSYGYQCSMSRKGNCWDNAPMESFWGKLKQEWLNSMRFKTRDEAKAAVFEYIWIFYNRKRIHEANGYVTPEEYYALACA
jgi:Transposase and inactivated derivatives